MSSSTKQSDAQATPMSSSTKQSDAQVAAMSSASKAACAGTPRKAKPNGSAEDDADSEDDKNASKLAFHDAMRLWAALPN
jgi:hypothetical protein